MKTNLQHQRLNYDAIAHLYDEPLRDHDVDAHLLRFLAESPDLESGGIRILDMGCGTGKQLAANRQRFPDLEMAGLDLFAGMLRQARQRCQTVNWVHGDSAAPPFADNAFHYVTNQFSYPHVQHKEAMMAATYRVLRPNGRFVMTNIDPWAMPNWIIYRYFPAAQQHDHRDYLRAETFVGLMETAGFTNVQVTRRQQTRTEDLRQLLDYASQRFRTSQFMILTDTDYEAGLERIRRDIENAGDTPVTVQSDFCLITITGDKR